MLKTRIIFFITLILFVVSLARAKETVSHVQNSEGALSLEDCLRVAYQKSPRITQVNENLRAAKGQYWGSTGEFFPHVSINNTYTYNSIAPLGSASSFLGGKGLPPSFVSQDYYDLSFSVSQQIFSWRMKPTFSIGKAIVRQAESQLKKIQNDLTLDVKKAYFGVLFAKQALLIAQNAESVTKDTYETSRQLYKEGKVSHFDVSRAKVSWVNSKTGTIQAKNDLRLSKEALKTTLGLSQNEEIEIEGDFPDLISKIKLEEQIQNALRYRPEIKELEQVKKMSKETIEIARSGFLPIFGASYRYSMQGADLTSKQDDYYDTWAVGAYLTIPLFDGGSSIGRLNSAKASFENIKAMDRAATDGIILEVKQSFLSLQDAAERLPAQKENVDTANENLRIAQERYALGLLSHLELKDAELSFTEAKTQYVKALFDYNVAMSALDRAVGLPFHAGK